jgi:hypothetical protein
VTLLLHPLIVRLESDLEVQIEHTKISKKGSGQYADSTRELSELLGVDLSPPSASSSSYKKPLLQDSIQGGNPDANIGNLSDGAAMHAPEVSISTQDAPGKSSHTSGTGAGNGDSSSQMISVLQAQRDRYKDRLTQVW